MSKKKEAALKAMFWRFGVSIPVGLIATLLFFGTISKSLLFVIMINIVMIVLHWVFELTWPPFYEWAFGGKDGENSGPEKSSANPCRKCGR